MQITPREFRFIHSEKYNLESAIVNAAKAAYLSKMIEMGVTDVQHYSPDDDAELISSMVEYPLPTKLNKLKKTNTEAFFYWNEIQKLMRH